MSRTHRGMNFYNGQHLGYTRSPFALTEALLHAFETRSSGSYTMVHAQNRVKLSDGGSIPSIFD